MLRDRRIELGISQTELANRMNKSQMHIWQWESGKVSPRLDSLTMWSRELNCHVEIVANKEDA